MKVNKFISEDKLMEKAISLLMKELGPVETNRFLSIIPAKRKESVRRHQEWQSKLDKEHFLNEVFPEKNDENLLS